MKVESLKTVCIFIHILIKKINKKVNAVIYENEVIIKNCE